MKDLLEPFFYPQNLFLIGLFIACVAYRKKGLWLLFAWFYLLGNSYLANQLRSWYQAPQVSSAQISAAQAAADTESVMVVLGCGGSASQLPACARSRLDQLGQLLTADSEQEVVITTRYCEPYVDYVQQRYAQARLTCFNGGDNTYQEFYHLAAMLPPDRPVTVITSDYHGWRAGRLLAFHQLNGEVRAASTQTFRAVNCNLNCFLTVNLTNYDFYSKLLAEFFSYGVYAMTRSWVDWTASEE
ncbi:ElyC/SanA/YdcF family protein [Chromatiaceae bacterium AAb-1]|nr:ElyC/SanA/YdcF family protein [Chromatiaceae bacterium AAb-1]